MLATATTSSMTNSMKVPDDSSTPTGWMRMNIHASPRNRSSTTKRSRHFRMLIAPCASARNWRHSVMMMAWIASIAQVQVPAMTALIHRLDRKPTVHDQQQRHQRGGEPVLGEQPQQLIVEGRPRSGGRSQPITGLTHALRGGAPTLRRRAVGRRGKDRGAAAASR